MQRVATALRSAQPGQTWETEFEPSLQWPCPSGSRKPVSAHQVAGQCARAPIAEPTRQRDCARHRAGHQLCLVLRIVQAGRAIESIEFLPQSEVQIICNHDGYITQMQSQWLTQHCVADDFQLASKKSQYLRPLPSEDTTPAHLHAQEYSPPRSRHAHSMRGRLRQ